MLSEMLRLRDILYEPVESNAVTFSDFSPSNFPFFIREEISPWKYIYIDYFARYINIYIFFLIRIRDFRFEKIAEDKNLKKEKIKNRARFLDGGVHFQHRLTVGGTIYSPENLRTE